MVDGEPREARVFLRHRKGHRVPVRIRTSPVYGEDGRIVGAVEVFSDDTPRVALEEQLETLEQLAVLDALTSLPNRRHAEQQLVSKHGEWERYGWPYAVLMVDIDYFKRVNDTWGHDAGDRALIAVGKTLSGMTRVSDVVARWGGEEFMVIARCGGTDQLTAMAESLRGLVAATRFSATGGTTASLTVSIGGAVVEQSDRGPMDVVKVADESLYEAKRGGRNRFVCGLRDRLVRASTG